ncbi:MAG: transposase [Thermoplasmatota archaeon]
MAGRTSHVAFLPYRLMDGFLRKLLEYIPKLETADYTTVCKRLQRIQLDISLQDIPNDVIVAVDATGMKVSSRGEWMRHKWKVRKGGRSRPTSRLT